MRRAPELMRRLVLLLFLTGCVPVDGSDGPPDDSPPITELGPDDRIASVVSPDGFDAAALLPVVFALGGYDNLASDFDDWLGWSERVDALGFHLVLPDGLVDEDGSPFWNATDACCDFYESGVDDVAWLSGLVDEAVTRLGADPDRVFFFGHSAGGFMAYRMACEPDSPVTGVMSLAGSSWLDPGDCEATHPITLLQAHGLADDIMPFEGDDEAPGAAEVVGRWAARAGCDPASLEPDPTGREYVDDGVDDESVITRYTEGCDPGSTVEMVTLGDSDHYPELRPEFTDAVLDHFLSP